MRRIVGIAFDRDNVGRLHNDGANVLLGNGHVKWHKAVQIIEAKIGLALYEKTA